MNLALVDDIGFCRSMWQMNLGQKLWKLKRAQIWIGGARAYSNLNSAGVSVCVCVLMRPELPQTFARLRFGHVIMDLLFGFGKLVSGDKRADRRFATVCGLKWHSTGLSNCNFISVSASTCHICCTYQTRPGPSTGPFNWTFGSFCFLFGWSSSADQPN